MSFMVKNNLLLSLYFQVSRLKFVAIIFESMRQDSGFTSCVRKVGAVRLRNCFSSATVEPKDKSDSGIIEFSFLSVSKRSLVPGNQ